MSKRYDALHNFEIPTITMVDDKAFNELTSESDIVKSLKYACEEIGFFYLKVTDDDDGIHNSMNNQRRSLSTEHISKVFEQSKKFFDLPLHVKQQFVDSELNRGYTAMGEETLDPSNQTVGDTKEGYYIANDIPKDSPFYNPAKLSGPNIWPTTTTTTMDLDCELWKQTMNDYFEKLSTIGSNLVQLIALAIFSDNDDSDSDCNGSNTNTNTNKKHYFDDKFNPPMAVLRLLHYSNKKSHPDDGIFACGAHSDYGMITLLATDDQPGLQILIENEYDDDDNTKKKEQQWIDVAPPPIGTFVVNLGDMLERWTNGIFKSTIHRVVSIGSKERYSIPFFYEPNFDTVVECINECRKKGEQPKYSRTTAGGHLLEKYNQTHADFCHQTL